MPRLDFIQRYHIEGVWMPVHGSLFWILIRKTFLKQFFFSLKLLQLWSLTPYDALKFVNVASLNSWQSMNTLFGAVFLQEFSLITLDLCDQETKRPKMTLRAALQLTWTTRTNLHLPSCCKTGPEHRCPTFALTAAKPSLGASSSAPTSTATPERSSSRARCQSEALMKVSLSLNLRDNLLWCKDHLGREADFDEMM